MKNNAASLRQGRDFTRVRPTGAPHPGTSSSEETAAFPAPLEVLGEIWLVPAIHLAIALAVVVALRIPSIG